MVCFDDQDRVQNLLGLRVISECVLKLAVLLQQLQGSIDFENSGQQSLTENIHECLNYGQLRR